MSNTIVKDVKARMDKSVEAMKRDFASIRAGRANPQILDRVMVDYYGVSTPISQLGNVSVPEPRVLMISVWDAGAMSAVEKAIQKADIGINPNNDGKVIRLVFPELTEERRKEIAKGIGKRAEEAKVAVRSARREANEDAKKMKKDNEISEDELHDLETDVQDRTDEFIKLIDKLSKEKEKEIMEL